MMRRLWPAPIAEVEVESVYLQANSSSEAPSLVGSSPFVAINMVSTLDGRTRLDGRARGIGSPTDRQLMYQLRANVDIVLNGAGTLRADEVVVRLGPDLQEIRRRRGQSPQPRYAVVSTDGDIPLGRKAFGLSPAPVVLLGHDTPPGRVAELQTVADVVVLAESRPSPAAILAVLEAKFDAHRVLLEGGPTLNQAFLAAGLVDELFLTLAPKVLGGPPDLPIVAGAAPLPEIASASLSSVFMHGDELFLRYSFASRQGGQ